MGVTYLQAENTFSGLSDDDYANLTASGLSDETIRARGYKTITSTEELLTLGFSNVQSKLVPCLYMPRLDKTGESHLGIIRPMAPRIKKNGEGRKYEIAFGDKMQIDFPVANHNTDKIDDPTCDLYVTEGIKKGDALAQNGLAAIDLLGVWNFKGRTAADGTAAIWPGYDEVPLFRTDPNGRRHARTVVIAFDSDVARKKEVHDAMMRFAALLGQRGARVQYLYLPAMSDGAKQGADDFFAGGGTLAEFLGYIKDKIEPVNVYDAMPDKDLGKFAKSLGLQMTEKGKVQENFVNYVKLLGKHHDWAGRLQFDTFRSMTTVDKEPLSEHHGTQIGMAFGTEFGMGGNAAAPRMAAIHHVAKESVYDSLYDFLTNLESWDGIPRLRAWMHIVCGADDTEINGWIGYVTIMQMVARGFIPGCIGRYVPVMEGEEGTGKTRCISVLGAGMAMTFDMSMDSKEAHMAIQGKWVAELAELDTLRRTSETRLKSFVTQTEDTFVPKYSNLTVSYPRRTVFIGTTNDTNYLQGLTGNTRFLPIKTGQFNIELLIDWRDQMFAEAIALLRENPELAWWEMPNKIVENLLVELRDSRRVINEYEGPLNDWLNGKAIDSYMGNGDPVYSKYLEISSWPDVAQWFLKLDTPERWKDKSLQMQIASAFKAIGWVRSSVKNKKTWHRPKG